MTPSGAMKIIFMGSSSFAVPSFQALVKAGYDISCAVTQPDRKRGRHLHLEGTPVKKAAERLGVGVYQPQSVNTPAAQEYLQDQQPDLFVVIAYGQILDADVLHIPRLGAVNAHASLLPRYRGAAPMNWTIINGDLLTGVSVMLMNERMDAGGILFQEEYRIRPDETVLTLESVLSRQAVALVLEAVAALASGTARARNQNRNKVTFAPKLRKKDGLLDWSRSAAEISNRVRGCLGWPGAFTYYKGKRLLIHAAYPRELTGGLGPGKQGEILGVSHEGVFVATGSGILAVSELQLEGGRRMPASEFCAGHTLCPGAMLGAEPPG